MKSGQPVGKIARRLGIAPTVKTLKILERRPTPPGQHPSARRTKSVFAQQLIEKQKLRFQFMISERVLRRNFGDALRIKGNSGANLICILDQRLDATIFRSGVVRSILAARQLVTHRHVFVDGKRVDKPAFRVRTGQTITFSAKARNFTVVQDGLQNGLNSSYIELNREQASIRRVVDPERTAVPVECNEQMIVEWYSR